MGASLIDAVIMGSAVHNRGNHEYPETVQKFSPAVAVPPLGHGAKSPGFGRARPNGQFC
jgi:hypothetical protein